MRKRILGIMLGVVMCGSLLSGCSLVKETSTDDVVPQEETTQEEQAGKAEEGQSAETPEAEETETTEQTSEEAQKNAEDVPTIGDKTNIYVIVSENSGASGREVTAIKETGEAAGYTIIIGEHGGNADTQQGFFDDAMKDDNAAAIICDHAGAQETTDMVAKAKEDGIPTVLVNTGIDVEGSAIAQILTNSYASATEASKAYIEHLSGEGLYVEILGDTSNINAYNATNAFHDVVSEYDMLMDRQVVGDEYNLEDSETKIRKMLEESPDSVGLVCFSGIQAQAGANVADSLGRDISILCFNGDDNTEELVKSGSVYAAVIKPAQLLGDKAIKEVIQYLEEGSTGLSEVQYEKGVLIRSDNAS